MGGGGSIHFIQMKLLCKKVLHYYHYYITFQMNLSSAQETCKKKSLSTELNKIHNLVNGVFLQSTKLEPTNSTTACLVNTPHPELNSFHSTSDISSLVALWSKCLPSYNAITKKVREKKK